MTKHIYTIIIALITLLIFSCKPSELSYDASGSFEAVERIISAEATGKIESLNIEEGQTVNVDDTIGRIDISTLLLQAEQIQASIHAIQNKTNDAAPQIEILKAQLQTQQSMEASLEQQISVLDKEVNRFQTLVESKAAPQKQLDDLKGQKSILQKQLKAVETQSNVIRSQMDAAKRNVNIQNRGILSEVEPNQKRLEIIEKQIQDGIIINRYPGTILNKYAYDGEFTTIGKPLYKIADLTNIILRVYITGDQLAKIKLNESLKVLTDDGTGGFNESSGEVTWISNKAEFTPKTIQTKDERANLVYAVKVKLTNDGSYKIGMYGAIKFN